MPVYEKKKWKKKCQMTNRLDSTTLDWPKVCVICTHFKRRGPPPLLPRLYIRHLGNENYHRGRCAHSRYKLWGVRMWAGARERACLFHPVNPAINDGLID